MESNASPLVSVIMPVYNAQKYMRASIESVIRQTYSNWELLLVDDGSKDRSPEIMKEYCGKDERIKCIFCQKNAGVASARNKGIEAAQGRYIAFLDSDDQWKEDKLRIQSEYMIEHGASFVYSAYDVIDENDNYIKTITPYWNRVGYKKLLNTNIIACCTTMIDAEMVKRDPMPGLPHEDYATWLNILKHNQIEAECIEGVWAIYRKVTGSVSSNKIKTIGWNWNIYRHNQKLGFCRSVKQVISFICMTGFKYLKK